MGTRHENKIKIIGDYFFKMNKIHISPILQTTFFIKIIGLLGILFLTTSCVTTSKTAKGDLIDHIMAQNSQMKKRLVLVERENDVLNQENRQYDLQVHDLTEEIEELQSDLTDMNDKYETLTTNSAKERKSFHQRYNELELKRNQEIKTLNKQITAQKTKYENNLAHNENKIQNLTEKYETLATNSAREIEKSNKRYEKLELKRNQELKALNDQITNQKIIFSKKQDELKQKYAAKEKKILDELKNLGKILDDREAQIVSLKKTNNEIAVKYDNILQQLEQVKLKRNKFHKDSAPGKKNNFSLVEKHKHTLK
jgi:chromosome segregation ATPase